VEKNDNLPAIGRWTEDEKCKSAIASCYLCRIIMLPGTRIITFFVTIQVIRQKIFATKTRRFEGTKKTLKIFLGALMY